MFPLSSKSRYFWKLRFVHGHWPCATSTPINSLARLGKYVRGAFPAIFAKFCRCGWSGHASTIHVPGPGTFPSSPSLPHRRCIFRVLNGIFLILDVYMLCSMPVRSQDAMWPKHELAAHDDTHTLGISRDFSFSTFYRDATLISTCHGAVLYSDFSF